MLFKIFISIVRTRCSYFYQSAVLVFLTSWFRNVPLKGKDDLHSRKKHGSLYRIKFFFFLWRKKQKKNAVDSFGDGFFARKKKVSFLLVRISRDLRLNTGVSHQLERPTVGKFQRANLFEANVPELIADPPES